MTSSAVWKQKLAPASELWNVTIQVIPRPNDPGYMAALFNDDLGQSEADPAGMVTLLERWGLDNGYVTSPASGSDESHRSWRVTLQQRQGGHVQRDRNLRGENPVENPQRRPGRRRSDRSALLFSWRLPGGRGRPHRPNARSMYRAFLRDA
jgi:hypothetical protein